MARQPTTDLCSFQLHTRHPTLDFRNCPPMTREASALVITTFCIALSGSTARAFDARGIQFIGFKSFSAFEKSKARSPSRLC